MNAQQSFLLRYPSASLLLIQLLGIVLYPFLDELPRGRAIMGTFGIVVLVAALRMVRRSPLIQWVAFTLAACILVLTIIGEVRGGPELSLTLAALEAAFYFYAAASLIAYMMEDQRATTDELFAVGATFTLLAWAFAYSFMVCQLLLPGSFTALLDPEAPRTWLELLFLSFSILSGVGIGDILPITPMARALVMLEQFAGVMYIALVVSRLIGLTIRR
ncbi:MULTISPECIES: ion channel [Pseudomonadaceae]|uniref:ion channel n=1 Tax=Pseudomonadaceae TaxID=135621 RepID=UPI00103F01F7|nr:MULTISPECIES: ion channel [Pseudomonadaceae]MBA1277820.1 two pore domain potassium channel family protein [Stutzerimonas stutzeri]MBC8650165.1 two pore domain potassium channel family protein [Pseudomonas sp. MT4]QXY93795.1 two pore domain potassium channel family protein [Pseudomonas sp. MTM4]TCD23842.1 two pore domain potassium channel family protein [Pseudomonas sp. IC_126]